MQPVQGLNLNRRYISELEHEMPVTARTCQCPHQRYNIALRLQLRR